MREKERKGRERWAGLVSDVGLYELIAISDDSPELPTIGKCRADLCEQLD